MSNLNEFKRFESDLKNSEELQKKLEEARQRIADAGQAKNDGEIVVAAAKELGYDITIAALEQAMAEAEPVDPAELGQIAGGFGDKVDGDNHDAWCLTAWHCFAATLHTTAAKENRKETCWSDYLCVTFSNYCEALKN